MTGSDFTGAAGTDSLVAEGGPRSTGTTEQAKHAASTAADETAHVSGVAQDEAKRVAAEAKTQLQGLMDQTAHEVDEQSRVQKGRLAGTMRTFGDDLDVMAAQSQDGLAASLAREVAGRAHSLSSHLDQREPQELLEEVREFARRKPGTFLLGALAAGVLAGRLTRGARAAQSDTGRPSSTEPGGSVPVASDGWPAATPASRPSPGAPLLHGTAGGAPLAGVDAPTSDPVYPAGSEVSPGTRPTPTSYPDPTEPGGRP